MAEKDHTVNAPVRLLLIDDEQGFVNVLAKKSENAILRSERPTADLKPFRSCGRKNLMSRCWVLKWKTWNAAPWIT